MAFFWELRSDKFIIMLIAAIIIYVIGMILRNPIWPIECLTGQGGCLNQIISLLWVGLLLAGLGVI